MHILLPTQPRHQHAGFPPQNAAMTNFRGGAKPPRKVAVKGGEPGILEGPVEPWRRSLLPFTCNYLCYAWMQLEQKRLCL